MCVCVCVCVYACVRNKLILAIPSSGSKQQVVITLLLQGDVILSGSQGEELIASQGSQGEEATHPGSQSDTVCLLCGQNFYGSNRKNNLKQHLAIHSGIRPFRCSWCPQSFIRRSHLKRHLGTRHKDNLMSE